MSIGYCTKHEVEIVSPVRGCRYCDDEKLDQIRRTATEAALRYVQKTWPHFYLNEADIARGLAALLGEK